MGHNCRKNCCCISETLILLIVIIMYDKKLSSFIYWDIRSFLLIIYSLQLAFLGIICSDIVGINIPILRQLISFIYLSFVPGTLIVRLLKLNDLKHTEILLYTVGLSVFTLMFTGFSLNIFGSHFISNPISTVPLVLTTSFIVIVLSSMCYKCDVKSVYPYGINERNDTKNSFLSPSALFLVIIPFLSVFGTYIVNSYSSNIILLLLIIIICFVVLVVGFNTKSIDEELYPLAIFVIAISLLFHNSLISNYLYGFLRDVHQEYYYSNLVIISGVWNSQLFSNVNSMLSIVFLAPIYSIICDLSLTWVFKIIYPLLFSLLPVAVFHISKKQTGNDITAFLSSVYFMSISTFYVGMLSLERQQIAELFFVILITIFISNIEITKKRLLALMFMFGIVVSHYGLSYLLLSFVILGYLFSRYVLNSKSDTFNPGFILVFFIFVISWYMYFSSGSLFQQVISLFSHYYNTLFEEIFDTKATDLIVSRAPSFWNDILKILYEISQFSIVVGFVYVLKNHKKLMFSTEYISFSFMLFCVLGSSLVYSNTGMNLHRLFHIASTLLSIYFIVGGYAIISATNNFMNKIHFRCRINPEKILTLFVVLFLLINTGFIQEVSKMDQNSISISQSSLMINKDTDSTFDKIFSSASRTFYRIYIPTQDFYGTTWISKNRSPMERIYVDGPAKNLLFVSYGMIPQTSPIVQKLSIYNSVEPNSYVYLKYTNVIYGLVSNELFSEEENAYFETNEFKPVINSKNKIYTNGANYIFK